MLHLMQRLGRSTGGFVRFYSRGDVTALFREAGDTACLALVDPGRDYVAVYDAGVARFGLRERFAFAGLVPPDAVPALMQAMDRSRARAGGALRLGSERSRSGRILATFPYLAVAVHGKERLPCDGTGAVSNLAVEDPES
jgi:hypothetical protein